MKKKWWMFGLIFAMLAVVCFGNLWKYESDPMKIISVYYGFGGQNHIRYLFKIMAYGFAYMVVAWISCHFLKEKANSLKCIVVLGTSLILVFFVLFAESWMQWAKWEYLFEPEVGYTVWFVMKGEIQYSATRWLAALRYILAFATYPVIHMFVERISCLEYFRVVEKMDEKTKEDIK